MNSTTTRSFRDLKGPKQLPIFGNSLDIKIPNLHNQLSDWANEYGPIYKLNLAIINLTIISDPVLNQNILKNRPSKFRRAPKMDRIIRESGIHGLFNAEGDDWAMQRNVITKGLDVKHQKQFFKSIELCLDRLLSKWENDVKHEKITDIQQDFLRFTVDVSTSLAFGIDMNTIEQIGSVIQDDLELLFPTVFKRINSPIQWHKFVKSKKDKAFDRAVVNLENFIDEIIKKGRARLAENPELKKNPSNLLESILVESEENSSVFTDKEVRGNLMIILLAGEDTTAHTLAWTVALLDRKQNIVDKIKAESDQLFGFDKRINSYDNHSQLKYTDAVAMEAMRLKPVAPVLLHEVLEDVELNGYRFTKGERLLNHLQHASKSNENFTDSIELKPERWLKESRCPIHKPESSMPFGAGARFCPGRNLAMLEIKSVLSMLYKNFNVEVLNPESIHDIMAFTMMPSKFKVKLSKK